MNQNEKIFLDAGVFIGALLEGDSRHSEARIIVERARRGELFAYTTVGILSEVYAALTWINAQPPHSPSEAEEAVRLLVEPPSEIKIISDNLNIGLKMLEFSKQYGLKAREIHDARHAVTSLMNGITTILTMI